MNDEVRQKLCEIVNEHGPTICDNTTKLENLLRDMCGQYKREIHALVCALRGGAVSQLQNSTSPETYSIASSSLIRGLANEFALEHYPAAWAVDSWAVALGVITSSQANKLRAKLRDSAHRGLDMHILLPKGGDIWRPGNFGLISWLFNWSGLGISNHVRIELVRQGTVDRVLAHDISTPSDGNGSYKWTIPRAGVYGNGWRVRITSAEDVSCTALSSSDFTIMSEKWEFLLKEFQNVKCSWCGRFFTKSPWMCIHRRIRVPCLGLREMSDNERAKLLNDDSYWFLVVEEMDRYIKRR